MKSNKNIKNKFLISILLIILLVLLIYFLKNIKYKLLEGNDSDEYKTDGNNRLEGVEESLDKASNGQYKVKNSIDNTTPHLYDEQGNPDIIDDSTLKNEYMDAIKTPKEMQKEMKISNDELDTLGYLRRGLNYAKIFISADPSSEKYSVIKKDETLGNAKIFISPVSSREKYSVIKKDKTLGKEKLVETIKNCTHCYIDNTWQTCDESAYKIVNNIPQSKNGIIPGILENVLRVMPKPAVDLIVPKVKVEKTSDLLKIKNNDIKCVNYDSYWVMIDGMYDIPYKKYKNIYETGSTEDIKGIKEKFKKQEQFSNINNNQDDIIINLYYFTLVCFFMYIITKLMIKQ